MKNQFYSFSQAAALLLFLHSFVSCDFKDTAAQASVVKPAAGKVAEVNQKPVSGNIVTNSSTITEVKDIAIPPASEIMQRRQIPILCYHQVREYRPTDSRSARDYIVPPGDFRNQMKGLADSGYTTILPDQLYRYLVSGESLPEKAVMISFDDGCDEQFDVTREVLKPLDFKAAFFIMTVSVNRPNFMKADQLKQLSDEGHSIGLHTWDHHNVKQYTAADWVTQVEKPRAQLEKITGKKVEYFAYPFGLWNEAAIPELRSRGMIAAFQLSTPRHNQAPLHTIRRIIVPGGWTGAQLVNRMKSGFKG